LLGLSAVGSLASIQKSCNSYKKQFYILFIPFSITTHDGSVRPVQSREHALIGRSHLVLLDSLRNIELINQRKITSISIKEDGWRP